MVRALSQLPVHKFGGLPSVKVVTADMWSPNRLHRWHVGVTYAVDGQVRYGYNGFHFTSHPFYWMKSLSDRVFFVAVEGFEESQALDYSEGLYSGAARQMTLLQEAPMYEFFGAWESLKWLFQWDRPLLKDVGVLEDHWVLREGVVHDNAYSDWVIDHTDVAPHGFFSLIEHALSVDYNLPREARFTVACAGYYLSRFIQRYGLLTRPFYSRVGGYDDWVAYMHRYIPEEHLADCLMAFDIIEAMRRGFLYTTTHEGKMVVKPFVPYNKV